VVGALKCVLDATNHPILICCNLGRHHTGTVIGCLRKLQRWNLTSILEEYRRYAGSKVVSHRNEKRRNLCLEKKDADRLRSGRCPRSPLRQS